MNEKVYIIFDNIVRFRFNSQNCKAFLLKEAFTFNLIEIGLKLPHIFFTRFHFNKVMEIDSLCHICFSLIFYGIYGLKVINTN